MKASVWIESLNRRQAFTFASVAEVSSAVLTEYADELIRRLRDRSLRRFQIQNGLIFLKRYLSGSPILVELLLAEVEHRSIDVRTTAVSLAMSEMFHDEWTEATYNDATRAKLEAACALGLRSPTDEIVRKLLAEGPSSYPDRGKSRKALARSRP